MTTEQKAQLRKKIDLGVRASIASALEEHAKAGRKVAIWRDNRIEQLIPRMAPASGTSIIREDPPTE
jgi:hypothetical protein